MEAVPGQRRMGVLADPTVTQTAELQGCPECRRCARSRARDLYGQRI